MYPVKKQGTWLLSMLAALSVATAADFTAGLGSPAKMAVDRGVKAEVNAEGALVVVREIPAESADGLRAAVSFTFAEPLDFTGKAVAFELRGTAEADYILVYANNRGSKTPSLKGELKKGSFFAADWREAALWRGGAVVMSWAGRGCDGMEPNQISTLNFLIFRKGPVPAGELKLELRNLRLVPIPVDGAAAPKAPPVAPPKAAAAGPDVSAFAAALGGTATVGKSPDAKLEFDPASGVLATKRAYSNNLKGKTEGGRVVVTLKNPLDLSGGKALQFDLRAHGGGGTLYVKLYNRGAKSGSWSFYSYAKPARADWRTITLQQSYSSELNWYLAAVDGNEPKEIDRIEFVYERFSHSGLPDGEIGIALKDLRMGKPASNLTALTAPAKLVRETALVEAGRAAFTILHPDTPAGVAAAAAIAAAVEKATGVRPATRPGVTADRLTAGPMVMVGNVWNNPAMQVLYGRRLTSVDEAFPGRGGWVVETVKDAFRSGEDMIVVGASDDAGLAQAAERFAGRIAEAGRPGELRLPLLYDYDYAGNYPAAPKIDPDFLEKGLKSAQETLDSGRHQSLAGELARIAERYRLHRQSEDAKVFAAVAALYDQIAVPNARNYGGPWGHDSDFSALEAITGWDVVEHDPALTEAERLAATKMFARWAHAVLRAKAQMGENEVAHNHGTFAALGAFFAGTYFNKYYADAFPDGAILVDAGERIFKPQLAATRVDEDCNGYQWLTWEHIMRYSVACPDDTVKNNGVARKMVESMIVTMDNDHYQTPMGDTGAWTCYQAETIPLNMASYLLRDDLTFWAAQVKKERWGMKRFGIFSRAQFPAAAAPEPLTGMHLFPLDPAFFRTFPPQNRIPAEASGTFDKVSFRKNFEQSGFYLLLDGVNIGGHGHEDANSVERLMNYGRQWLADNDYYKGAARFHNSLMIFIDGKWEAFPAYAELIDRRDESGYALISARLAGATYRWTRHLLWVKKSDAVAVFDVVESTAAAEAVIRQRWFGLGEIESTPNGFRLTQRGGPAMRFESLPGVRTRAADDYELGAHWAGYPYAERVVRNFEFILDRRFEAGGKGELFALIHGSADGSDAPAPIERLSAGGVRFTVGGETLALVPEASGKLKVVTAGAEKLAALPPEKTGGAAAGHPALEPAARVKLAARSGFVFTAPQNRPASPFRLTGTAPAAENIFMPTEPNVLDNLVDSKVWPTAGSQTLFPVDATVELAVDFERETTVSGVKFLAYWFANSRFGTKHQLRSAKVLLSNDNFASDCREVAAADAADWQYADSITPVETAFAFAPQAAKQVKLLLVPRENAAIDLGEIAVVGNPEAGTAVAAVPTDLVAVNDAGRKLAAVSTASGEVQLLDADGRVVSTFAAPARINRLAAGDLDGDGRDELVLGCEDTFVRVFGLDGKLRWERQIPYYRQPAILRSVLVADVDGDGKPEVLAGAANWRAFAFDRDGKALWNYEIVRESRDILVDDFDGDGRREILCTTKYYTTTLLDDHGLPRWRFRFPTPGCKAAAAVKTGDGAKKNIVFGADGGTIHFVKCDGGLLAEFSAGDEVGALAVNADPAGKEAVYAGSLNEFCYRFDPAGRLIRQFRLDGGVTALLAGRPGAGVWAGTDAGGVFRMTADDRVSGKAAIAGSVLKLVRTGDRVFALGSAGELAVFSE
jgi:hypothetical protein